MILQREKKNFSIWSTTTCRAAMFRDGTFTANNILITHVKDVVVLESDTVKLSGTKKLKCLEVTLLLASAMVKVLIEGSEDLFPVYVDDTQFINSDEVDSLI